MSKTPREAQLEALLAETPDDPLVHYGIAMERLGQGDNEAAAAVFLALIARTAAEPYIPAYLQGGQVLMRLGREPEAADVLRRGVAEAQKAGDLHAASEMSVLLTTVE